MKLFISAVLALVAFSFAAVDNAHAQRTVFKGSTAGALVKVGAGGIVDEATTGTATSTASAATINADSGTITTESLTTAAAAVYTMTLTNSKITAASKVFASVSSTGTGVPVVTEITPAAGSAVILIQNNHASAAFNAVLLIKFFVVQ